MEFWLWMPQLFACTRARIKTQINRGLSPIISISSVKTLTIRKALMEKTLPLVRRTGFQSPQAPTQGRVLVSGGD